jgi:hypothetical protein
METTIERKTAAYVMVLWKYKLLDQDDALWPKSGSKHQRRECGKREGQGKGVDECYSETKDKLE